LVPGITSPAITWGFVAEELAATHDVHVLDVRGRGLSEAGPHLDYRLDACAGDLVALAKALGLADAVLLGHSMGARHAVRAFALDRRMTGVCQGRAGRSADVRPWSPRLPRACPGISIDGAGAAGAGVDTLRAFTPTWTDEQIACARNGCTCDQAAILFVRQLPRR
jgi:N-formylmaleamate deformylase